MTSTLVVGYIALFVILGAVFLAVNLLLGWLIRPNIPHPEKQEIYECGEPTIGSSFVQFDLRFYVVALLFIIFDVEVAFFFPWAVAYGKLNDLRDPNLAVVESVEGSETQAQLTPAANGLLMALGVPEPEVPLPEQGVAANSASVREHADTLTLTSIADILVFFAVLMVGFAYVWRRGDLDWVRAVGPSSTTVPPRPSTAPAYETALAG